MYPGVNRIVFICGKKEHGKTWLANKLAMNLNEAGARVLCIDPKSGFWPQEAVLILGGKRTSILGELATLGGQSAVVRVRSDSQTAECLAFVRNNRRLWLFVDEVSNCLGPHRPNKDLLEIIRFGRHDGISLVAICQRPAQVHKDLISQADDVITFRIEEPNDLDYLAKFCSVTRSQLKTLEKRHFLWYKA